MVQSFKLGGDLELQRLGVGAGWRSQTASPGAQRCAEGPPEPYPYHLFIDSVPRSHSGAAYRSWHGRERGCGGKEASPRLRGSPRLFNCADSAGRAQPGPGGRTGVCVGGGRDTGTLLSPGNPASLPRASLPQRPDWPGPGRGEHRRSSEDAAPRHCDLSHPQKAGSGQGEHRAAGRAEAVQGVVSQSSCFLASSWLDQFASALYLPEKECMYV